MTPTGAWAEFAAPHSAIVLFVGDRAYKLKKPVKFDYFDFSTRPWIPTTSTRCRRSGDIGKAGRPWQDVGRRTMLTA